MSKNGIHSQSTHIEKRQKMWCKVEDRKTRFEQILPAIQGFINGITHSPIFIKRGLVRVFANGLLSATILPIPMEIVISALLSSGCGKLPVFVVLAISSTVGRLLGYYIWISCSKLFRFFKGKPNKQNVGYGVAYWENMTGYRSLTRHGFRLKAIWFRLL